MNVPSKEQFAGSLLGQCLGDALGSPVEGRHPVQCRSYVEQVLRAGKAAEARRGDAPFGQYTDDSQLARELMESLVRCQGWRPEDYARRIADIFAEGRIFGCGRATLEAAQRLQKGAPWRSAGTPAPAAGNGSAMRTGPVGLFFFDRHEELVQVASEQSLITHQDPRCLAGSVAISGAVALALQPGPIVPMQFLSAVATLCESVEAQVAGHLRDLAGWLELPPEQAVGPISRAGADPATPTAGTGSRPSSWAARYGACMPSCARRTTTSPRSAPQSRWAAMWTPPRRWPVP